MDDFLNVIRRDPKVQLKLNDFSDKYNTLQINYQSKRRYDNLIQNVILEKLIKLMSVILVDIDIELKMKISRIKYLQSKL